MSNLPAIRQERAVELVPDLDKALEQARVLIRSGLIPKCYDTPEKVVTVMLKGRELGLGPMVALQHLFPTGQGNVGMDGQVIQLLIQRAGHTFQVLERSEQRCCIRFCPKGGAEYDVEVTMAEAAKAGWNMEPDYQYDEKTHQRVKKGMREKHTWKTQPATMLFWRCLAKGARQGMGAALNDAPLLTDEYEVVESRQGLYVDSRPNVERDRSLPVSQPRNGRGRLYKTEEPPGNGHEAPGETVGGEAREVVDEAPEETDNLPAGEPEPTPSPAPWDKWSESAKRGFWATLGKLGLDHDTVHAEFGVQSMTEYAGGQPRAATLVHILKHGLGQTLTLEQLHEALAVVRIVDWQGSLDEAKDAIDSWVAESMSAGEDEEIPY